MFKKNLMKSLQEVKTFDIDLVLDQVYKFRVKRFNFNTVDEILVKLDYLIHSETGGLHSLNVGTDISTNLNLQKKILNDLFAEI